MLFLTPRADRFKDKSLKYLPHKAEIQTEAGSILQNSCFWHFLYPNLGRLCSNDLIFSDEMLLRELHKLFNKNHDHLILFPQIALFQRTSFKKI